MRELDHDYLVYLREHHPVLRLVAAQNLPLIAGFLSRIFVDGQRREVRQAELEALLGDYLQEVQAGTAPPTYKGAPRSYLDDWSRPELPLLRKFYVSGEDQPVFDLTPAMERALGWLSTLEEGQFVGTESRLSTVIDLLREMVEEGAETAEERLQRLLHAREKLDVEIERARRGDIVNPDQTRLRERFLRLQEVVRQLLSDFRQVEENFRTLDRATRSRIALADAAKGLVLDEIFAQQDSIVESDEGRSFRAFWELLLRPAQQREMLTMLERVLKLQALDAMDKDPALMRLLGRLTRAGEQVAKTLARLNEQLRSFLDDRLWLENRRVAELARSIERHAIELRDTELPIGIARLDDVAPTINSLMSRRLYAPPTDTQLQGGSLQAGDSNAPLDKLFEQSFVDLAALRATLDRLLQARSQLTLGEVLHAAPLREGLAELLGYLKLASEDRSAHIDDKDSELVEWQEGDRRRRVRVPQVIFVRA
ncbi:MAG: DUF3375 domain-containing protein [Solimonas sp.]